MVCTSSVKEIEAKEPSIVLQGVVGNASYTRSSFECTLSLLVYGELHGTSREGD